MTKSELKERYCSSSQVAALWNVQFPFRAIARSMTLPPSSDPRSFQRFFFVDLDEVVVVGYGPQEDSTPGAVGVKGENTDQAFTVVETMPKFPEGQAGLMRYLARSIKYPVIAQKNKEQGRVIIQMIIGTDGSLSNVKVLRSVSPSLDAEAIRVVGNMPKWEPGMQKGQAVPVKYTLPITFRLQ